MKIRTASDDAAALRPRLFSFALTDADGARSFASCAMFFERRACDPGMWGCRCTTNAGYAHNAHVQARLFRKSCASCPSGHSSAFTTSCFGSQCSWSCTLHPCPILVGVPRRFILASFVQRSDNAPPQELWCAGDTQTPHCAVLLEHVLCSFLPHVHVPPQGCC